MQEYVGSGKKHLHSEQILEHRLLGDFTNNSHIVVRMLHEYAGIVVWRVSLGIL